MIAEINISRKNNFFYSGDHALQNSKEFKLKSTRTKNKSTFLNFFLVKTFFESFGFLLICTKNKLYFAESYEESFGIFFRTFGFINLLQEGNAKFYFIQ